MNALFARAVSSSAEENSLLPETLEELQATLDKLHIASEELHKQNEALLEVRLNLIEEHHRCLERV